MLTVIGDRSTPLRGVEGELLDTPLRFGQQGNAFFALVGSTAATLPAGTPSESRRPTPRAGPPKSLTITVTARWFPRQYLAVDKSQEELVSDDTSWNEDRARVGRASAASASRPLWTGAFQMPVAGQVTTAYGFLRYVNGQVEGQHSGLDLACEEGTPVHAAQAGVVVLSTPSTSPARPSSWTTAWGCSHPTATCRSAWPRWGRWSSPATSWAAWAPPASPPAPTCTGRDHGGPVAVDPRILLQADPLQGAEWPAGASGPQAALTPPHQTHAAAPRG